jgi:hypothetical protein
VQIHTPVGAIGLRGTAVWGGPIDKGYGVIVLNAEVTVTGRRGTVTLKQGQGTMLFGDGKPQRAAAWPAGRMKRAAGSTVGEALGLVLPSLLRAACRCARRSLKTRRRL